MSLLQLNAAVLEAFQKQARQDQVLRMHAFLKSLAPLAHLSSLQVMQVLDILNTQGGNIQSEYQQACALLIHFLVPQSEALENTRPSALPRRIGFAIQAGVPSEFFESAHRQFAGQTHACLPFLDPAGEPDALHALACLSFQWQVPHQQGSDITLLYAHDSQHMAFPECAWQPAYPDAHENDCMLWAIGNAGECEAIGPCTGLPTYLKNRVQQCAPKNPWRVLRDPQLLQLQFAATHRLSPAIFNKIGRVQWVDARQVFFEQDFNPDNPLGLLHLANTPLATALLVQQTGLENYQTRWTGHADFEESTFAWNAPALRGHIQSKWGWGQSLATAPLRFLLDTCVRLVIESSQLRWNAFLKFNGTSAHLVLSMGEALQLDVQKSAQWELGQMPTGDVLMQLEHSVPLLACVTGVVQAGQAVPGVGRQYCGDLSVCVRWVLCSESAQMKLQIQLQHSPLVLHYAHQDPVLGWVHGQMELAPESTVSSWAWVAHG